MAVGITVDFYWYQIGTGDFFHSFFSTIAFNLEGGSWGSRFPVFMKDFYDGELKNARITEALSELDVITEELKKLPPDKVIWDIEDISKQPPWGSNISTDITDLSNYFVTSDGEDLITTIRDAFEMGLQINEDVHISSL